MFYYSIRLQIKKYLKNWNKRHFITTVFQYKSIKVFLLKIPKSTEPLWMFNDSFFIIFFSELRFIQKKRTIFSRLNAPRKWIDFKLCISFFWSAQGNHAFWDFAGLLVKSVMETLYKISMACKYNCTDYLFDIIFHT